MANKIDTFVDAVETTLNELVTAGTIKKVVQGILDPMTEEAVPAVCLYPLRAMRRGGSAAPLWDATLCLRILQRSKGSKGPETITELVKAVQGKIDTLSNSTSFGASIELSGWEFTYHFAITNSPIGAMAILKLKFEGAL